MSDDLWDGQEVGSENPECCGDAASSAGPLSLVDDRSFADRVLKNPRPVLVLFTAQGSKACETQKRWLRPLVPKLTESIDVVRCPLESAPNVARSYRIGAVPALLLLHRGKLRCSHVGLCPAPSIRGWVNVTLREGRGSSCMTERRDDAAGMQGTRQFLRSLFSPATRWRACKVAGVVGPALVLITHVHLFDRATLSAAVLPRLVLDFLVPYFVASYSAARAGTNHAEALNGWAGRRQPQAPARTHEGGRAAKTSEGTVEKGTGARTERAHR